MVKTVLKIDGMMCGMCESHMNDLIRKNFKVKKVTSSAKNEETVVISDAELDIPWAKKAIKDIGYELLSYTSEPYEKRIIPFWKIMGEACENRLCNGCTVSKYMKT